MSEKKEKKEMGRLAMRQEGNLWVAYYAAPDTMKDAIFLGSIQMAAVTDNPGRKHRFMGLMQDFLGDLLLEYLQADPDDLTWKDLRVAPEHERAGRA